MMIWQNFRESYVQFYCLAYSNNSQGCLSVISYPQYTAVTRLFIIHLSDLTKQFFQKFSWLQEVLHKFDFVYVC